MQDIIYHTYFASSPGVSPQILVSEAIRDARRVHAVDGWTLEGLYEYDREVYDSKGRLITVEAKVVVRHA